MDDSDLNELRESLAGLGARAGRLAERIAAELAFAGEFADLHPTRRPRWRKLIDKALAILAEAAASGRASRLTKAVAAAEETLAPIGKLAKTYTIHCIGHAHIDMNWQWSWPETVAVTNDTFITVEKLMAEFDEFCFTQSQASVYAIVQDHNPAMFERIKARVAEGRWEIAAVHWVEGDKNLAGGESLARHMLYTRRFMREHFGLSPEDVPLDWEPDTFGHAVTIPTVVTRGAARRYYLCRGGAFDKPPVFWWRGPDGSRLLVHCETTWYNGQIGTHAPAAMLAFCRQTGLTDWLFCYGVGDHGGGPTRRDILQAREMNSWPIYPTFRLTTTGDYFAVLEAAGDRWPVLDCELNFEFTGCYTSQSRIKQANRLGENRLLEAESAAAVALRALGRDYPAGQLRQCWIDTIFGHFHDILPGSGVRETREYQMGLFQKAAAAAGIIKTHSLRDLAAAVDTSFAGTGRRGGSATGPEAQAMGAGAGRATMTGGLSAAAHVPAGPRAFLVFNPTAWQRCEVVTATVWDAAGDAFRVRTPDGRAIPAQRTGGGNYWGHQYVELAFPASAGGLGYAAYAIEPGRGDATGGVEVRATVRGAPAMESDLLAVEFDPLSGGIVKLLDKAGGLDLADASRPMGVLEYVLERPGGMSAWTINQARRRIGPLEVVSLRPEHRGPHLASIVARMKLNDSTFEVRYVLKAGQPWLEVHLSANWLERGGPEVGTPSLRAVFPLALSRPKARYEVPFGSIDRDLDAGQEVPALRWADVTGRSPEGRAAGMALLNDCKYGHSLDGSTLALTLIRSSYEPDPLPEIGEHAIGMAVAPHAGALPAAEAIRLGAAFNHPLEVVATDVHRGELPAVAAAVSQVRPGGVVLSAVKRAEDSDALVFRLHETAGRAAKATVALDPRLLGTAAEAVEVDLLERPLDQSTARATKAGFTVAVPAFGIASVMVSFAK